MGGKRATAEESFLFKAAVKKRCDVFRAGWPDYLVFDRRTGEYRLVEVKNGPNDALRPSQVKMFEVLERMGLQVYVWTPHEPDALIRWRFFQKHTDSRAETRKVVRQHEAKRRATDLPRGRLASSNQRSEAYRVGMANWTVLSTAPRVPIPRLRAAVLCYRCEEPRVLFGCCGRVLPVRGEDEMVFVAGVTACSCGGELAAVGWTWVPDSGEPVS